MRVLAALLIVFAAAAQAATFDVGPGQAYTSIGDVPWESLLPGDTVRIHWRPESYREKWVIGRSGTAASPITVQGVAGPGGERPVISGDAATTRQALSFWNERRGLIKIGGSSVPANTVPEHIVIEGLELRSAHPDYQFTDDGGNGDTYAANAAGVYVETGRNLVVQDCVIHDNGNGIFIGSIGDDPTRNVRIERNWIHGNGNVGSIFEHNSYTEALGIVFEANHYGPLRAGALGNNLKDRSAGLVVRYNWIEAGNRQLDLVDTSPGTTIQLDPSYRTTHVYGNVLIETEGSGNRQIVHYGGDGGSADGYRKGTLHFYNNTIVSERAGRTTLFRLSTSDETADARNNVVSLPNATGDQLELVSDAGTLDWTHNWLEPGWTFSFASGSGVFNDAGTTVEGGDPGFTSATDFRPVPGSPLVNAGTVLHAAVLPEHPVTQMPVAPRTSAPRPDDGDLDIGALELALMAPGEVTDLLIADGATLTWQPVGVATYQVARGDLGQWAGTVGAAEPVCLASDLDEPTVVDGSPPPAGGAWYLVRARNGAGPGTWGPGRDVELQSICP